MDKEQFKILNDKIDVISKALVLNLVKDLQFKDKVLQLSNLGLKEKEIVELLNSNRSRVHSILWTKKN